ncbi:MAG TPA: 30S ribosome-binding factor RbfA, partial [Clostridiaceae bacterium]|nr:30S ribosome-binding factor RbfA [Clostridiaceae bacterium]
PPFTAITEVEMSNDLSVATCYVSVLGSDEQQEKCIQALRNAEGFLKREVTKQIRLRIAPELRFSLDRSVEEGMRMDRLIGEAMGRTVSSTNAEENDHRSE